MKPIVLYEANESTFASNGLGTLDEAISAEITEELNGILEMVFQYPISGKKFSEIKMSRIVKAISTPGGNYQLFRIYAISKVINGIVTVNAEHISYQLAYIPVNPFTATSAAEAMSKLGNNAMSNCPFTFWTDKQTTANYKQTTPDNIRARLAGVSGSILDVYGGEFEFNNYTVKLHNHRGQNRNVTLRYGKNITDIEQEENIASTYTSIVGFYKSDDIVVKTEVIDSQYAASFPFKRVKIVDFSQDFESTPTLEQLTNKATSYMNANHFGVPNVSIKVSFVALWQTEEYKNVAVLERVYLGDTVSVFYEKLGITASAKVVRTVYNVLLDRYDSIVLGSLRSNLSNKLAKQDAEIKEQITDAKTALEKAVEKVTELITGGTGGHVVLNADADGKIQEILVMNTEDINTATKVWRWNLGGLGYSSTGYNGTYGTAITMDGGIVADFITTGTMTANRVRAGLLEDESGTNYWNLSTGELRISNNTKIGSGNNTFQSIIDGIQNQIDGNITSWFYDFAPTTSNAPASSWNTVDLKNAHVGDLFYNSSTGYCYRWQIKPNVSNPGLNDFEWVRISDEDISAALRAANNAQDTADNKRRVFVSTPVPPYDVGDLWAQGATGDLMKCATAKASGQSYNANDWTKASKYTDDSALTNFISNTYGADKTNLQNQIDKKAETWYQSTDPSSAWTTDALKAAHVGDLWFNTSNNTTWFYNLENGTYAWKEQEVPEEVFDKIDGKAQVFTSTPTPPYNVGDLWFKGTSGDILTCMTAKTASQAYASSDWKKRNKYTDDTTANNVRSDLNVRIDGVVGEFELAISGIFANYSGDPAPSSSTLPESGWADVDKPFHVGEVYYKKPQGENPGVYYRYVEQNGSYVWEAIDTTNGNFNVVSSAIKQTKDLITSEITSVQNNVNDTLNQSFANHIRTSTPKTTNAPASSWTTDELKIAHNGDICYNKTNGKYYKWTVTFNTDGTLNTYKWVEQTVASKYDLVTSTANSKMQQTQDSIVLEVSKATQSLFTNYIGTEAPTVSNYPASSWSAANKKEHVGEVYYDKTTGKYYAWSRVDERRKKQGYLKVQFSSSSAIQSPNDYVTICAYKGNSSSSGGGGGDDDEPIEIEIESEEPIANTQATPTLTNDGSGSDDETIEIIDETIDEDTGEVIIIEEEPIEIIDEEEMYYTSKKITGTNALNINTLYMPDDFDTLRVYFHSDASTRKWGYKITSVELCNDTVSSSNANNYTIETQWPHDYSYTKNNDYLWESPHSYPNNVNYYAEFSSTQIADNRVMENVTTYSWKEIDTSTSAFATVSSQIKQTAEEIALKVSRGNVSSELSVEDSQITIGTGRLTINAENFKLDKNGNIIASNAELHGTVISGEDVGGRTELVNGAIQFYYDDNWVGSIMPNSDSGTRTFEVAAQTRYILTLEDSRAVEVQNINGVDFVCHGNGSFEGGFTAESFAVDDGGTLWFGATDYVNVGGTTLHFVNGIYVG